MPAPLPLPLPHLWSEPQTPPGKPGSPEQTPSKYAVSHRSERSQAEPISQRSQAEQPTQVRSQQAEPTSQRSQAEPPTQVRSQQPEVPISQRSQAEQAPISQRSQAEQAPISQRSQAEQAPISQRSQAEQAPTSQRSQPSQSMPPLTGGSPPASQRSKMTATPTEPQAKPPISQRSQPPNSQRSQPVQEPNSQRSQPVQEPACQPSEPLSQRSHPSLGSQERTPPIDYHQMKYSAFKSKYKGITGCMGRAPFASDYPEGEVAQIPTLNEIHFPTPRPVPAVGGHNQTPLPTRAACDKRQVYYEARALREQCQARSASGRNPITGC